MNKFNKFLTKYALQITNYIMQIRIPPCRSPDFFRQKHNYITIKYHLRFV